MPQPVVHESQRFVARERRQPQGQARELDCDGIGVHAGQAPFRNQPPDLGPLVRVEVGVRRPAFVHQRLFVGPCQIAARGHQERAAAHRRIDDPEVQDLIGRRAAHERREGPAYEELGERLRRVEGAGLLALPAVPA